MALEIYHKPNHGFLGASHSLVFLFLIELYVLPYLDFVKGVVSGPQL